METPLDYHPILSREALQDRREWKEVLKDGNHQLRILSVRYEGEIKAFPSKEMLKGTPLSKVTQRSNVRVGTRIPDYQIPSQAGVPLCCDCSWPSS